MNLKKKMKVKAGDLSCVICDVFKMKQSNGLLLHDKEKWRETQGLKARIWNCWKHLLLYLSTDIYVYIYHKYIITNKEYISQTNNKVYISQINNKKHTFKI